MQVARIYFCYGKTHATEPKELKLIGTVRDLESHKQGVEDKQLNLYQCPVCKLVQLIEEVPDSPTK